ncbi:histidine phosphatase superfamily [Chaetomium strumarium]|uniref:Histidine phosphatase superfamily n=1 Tax=Chaetomium strumarium TaxID=1170767 RepID=A0AAJ0GRC0_9PEZI|nr:histidine phosphatase superfamily [Chaetomium strumarium]
MRLFLVRHGETVDNVAGIYAGTRDSPLTSHGVLQARRLGAHLAALSARMGPVRHVFSSDLRRAVETAQAVVDAFNNSRIQASLSSEASQDEGGTADSDAAARLALVSLPELRERDFGSAEGAKYGVVSLTDAETREQMRARAERFVQERFLPLLEKHGKEDGSVVVVAHGMILDSLLRVLLARFGPSDLTPLGNPRAAVWSNTGYAELVVTVSAPCASGADGPEIPGSSSVDVVPGDRVPTPLPRHQEQRIKLALAGINVLKHLDGLKKTRGGIGSAQFDKRQRTMDSFFGPAAKKPRAE